MKTFLIMVLSTLLATGAFLSRPTEENFQSFLHQKLSNAGVTGGMNERAVGSMTDGCTFHDHWVYSSIEMNGKTVYAGVFSRWFLIPETVNAQGIGGTARPAGISAF